MNQENTKTFRCE